MPPPNPWLQYLLFPIVVGLVVLLGQFLIQPRIAARQHLDKTRWDARREVYAKALGLVNRKFASVSGWHGQSVPAAAAEIAAGPAPTREAVNDVYSELALFSSPEILRAFLACFGMPNGPITGGARFNLIKLMRADLGLGPVDFDETTIQFFLKP